MSTLIGIGFSKAADPAVAAKEAAVAVKTQLNSFETHLVIIFSTIGYHNLDVLQTIGPILNPHNVIGSSTAGIIFSDSVENKGIGIIGIISDEITVNSASISNSNNQDLHLIGTELGRSLSNNSSATNRQGLLYFADSSFKNQSLLLKGIQETVGAGLTVAGGVSSDNFTFTQSYQLSKGQSHSYAVTAALLGGNISLGVGCKHGWKPLGKPHVITSAQDNIINTIDSKPAINLYHEYFDDEGKSLPKDKLNAISMLYPIGIYNETLQQYLLRNPIDFLDDGSIVCQGDVPEQSEAHIMIGNKDSCKESALEASHEVKRNLYGNQAKAIIVFISAAHYKIFGRSAKQEIQIFKEVLGYTTPLIGMYTYGEIAPITNPNNVRQLHFNNGTSTVIAIV